MSAFVGSLMSAFVSDATRPLMSAFVCQHLLQMPRDIMLNDFDARRLFYFQYCIRTSIAVVFVNLPSVTLNHFDVTMFFYY